MVDSQSKTKILQSVLKLRDRAPKTREELDYYLRHFYNVFLAKKPIDTDNSSPLDFVWDIYSTAMGFNPAPVFNFLGMAARGSQKSLCCAVIEALLLTHDQFRDWFHMASIKEQSYVTYQYFKNILTKPIMNGITSSDPTMRETISRFNKQLKIGTATMDSVNSFHGSLVQDEVDLTPKIIFDESKGMLSAQQGRMPLNIAISSRKFAIGNIQNMIDKSAKDVDFPLKIYKWGILETTEQCTSERHGNANENIYVNEEDLIAISSDEYAHLSLSDQDKYAKMNGYENCLKCGIFSFCQGRLPNQDAGNPHLQPIEIAKSFFKTDNPDFFKSQRLNRKPSTTGLIYGMWDETIHVKIYAQMWQIFHGSPHPDTIPDSSGRPKRWDIELKELVDAFIKAGCRCVVGVDFGFSILAVCGLYFIDGSGRVYFVDELSYQGYTDSEVAAELKKNWGHLPVDIVIADPESPGGKKEIRKATGWGTHEKVDKSVGEGISTVRKLLRLPGSRETMFFVAPVCSVFREEVPNYRNKIDQRTQTALPEVFKRNDHSLDQARYVIHTIFGGITWDLNFRGQLNSTLNEFNANSPTRAPIAVELAQHVGASFIDNREDFQTTDDNKLLPKDDPKDPNGGGSSGFSWSF